MKHIFSSFHYFCNKQIQFFSKSRPESTSDLCSRLRFFVVVTLAPFPPIAQISLGNQKKGKRKSNFSVMHLSGSTIISYLHSLSLSLCHSHTHTHSHKSLIQTDCPEKYYYSCQCVMS